MTEQPPRIENAPGLVWRKRGRTGWRAVWQARTDIVKRGWEPTSITLWEEKGDLGEVDRQWIIDRCQALQAEMLVWGKGGIEETVRYDGTLKSLIHCYQTDPDSTYRKLEYVTRTNYDSQIRRLLREHGNDKVAEIKARTFLRWHQNWTVAAGETVAVTQIRMVRILTGFGATILECPECQRIRAFTRDMRFPGLGARHDRLTAEQATAIRKRAHERNLPSIALAQAFQFECTLRQKDVIGEWLPMSEPGPDDITDPVRGRKWSKGLRWSEIDRALILRHVTSKKKKPIEVDLHHAPMVMEELAKLGEVPAFGPVIVNDKGMPWRAQQFRTVWRSIATEVGVPPEVWNMDSRAGAITEATDSGAALEDVRHAATHSNISMTQRYSRGSADKVATVMQLRAKHRNKPGTGTE